MGMTPYVSGERDQSLQNPGKINYKDMYPPGNREFYYAVTVVDGKGQEDKGHGVSQELPGVFIQGQRIYVKKVRNVFVMEEAFSI